MKSLKTFWINSNKISNKQAFTLIELIIAVAIIALIASAVFVSVNPAKRFADAKDAIRASDAVALEKAVQQAIVDNRDVPVSMAGLSDGTPYMLVTEGGDDTGTCQCNTLDQTIARADIAADFKNFIGEVPIDNEASGDDTGYYIVKTSNSFKVSPCYAEGDEYVASEPETITCYFDQYDVGGEEWSNSPERMVDNNTSNFAQAGFGEEGSVERLTHSTCASETFGTISQVRIRQYGHCMFEDCGNTLRPVFGGTLDGDNHYEDVSIGSGWRSWYDITNDTNAPGTWTTSDVVNLDLDVEATISAGLSNKTWMVHKVELEVTHTP